MSSSLGRLVPPNFEHVGKYPLSAIAPSQPLLTVERVLRLPYWRRSHDQGLQSSCVGHAAAMERAITNLAQNKTLNMRPFTRRYDPLDLWREAKRIDGSPETDPANDDDGTFVFSAYDVLRDSGPWRIKSARTTDGGMVKVSGRWPKRDLREGVTTNRWARSVDEMRRALADGIPVVIGVNWYTEFDTPRQTGREWWIGKDGKLSAIDGGHAVCVYGASDRRQAFRVVNSWGRQYPLVWLPYDVMGRLLSEYGEAVVAVDR